MAKVSKPQVVAVDRPTGTHSLMFAGIRIDVKYKPLFDELASKRPSRSNYCEKHSQKLKQTFYCEEGKHHVAKDDATMMVEMDDGTLLPLSNEELKALEQPGDHVIELQAMMDWVDPSYVESTDVLWPADATWAKPYKILNEVLADQKKMLVGMMVSSGTPRAFCVRIAHLKEGIDVLVAHKCHHGITLRAPMALDIAAAVSDLPAPSDKELEMAQLYFNSLPTDYPIDAYVDDLGQAQWALLKAKKEGKNVEVREELVIVEEPVDLMAAMAASLQEIQKKKAIRQPAKDKVVH